MLEPLFVRSEQILATAVFCLLLAALVSIWYQHYLRMPLVRMFLPATVAVAAGVAWLWSTSGSLLDHSPLLLQHSRQDSFTYYQTRPGALMIYFAMMAFLVTFSAGCGLLIKLYRTWILDAATPAERQTGADGIRAWLSPLNIIVTLLLVLGAYGLLNWNLWQTALGTLLLLLSYPLFNTLVKSNAPDSAPDSVHESADERRRVLALVEAGKISADDGAELIGALGQSRIGDTARLEASGIITGNRRLMLLGAALVLVGFFFPWFSVNLAEQVRSLANGMQQQFQNALPMIPRELFPGTSTPAISSDPTPAALVLSVAGGDVAHGLGWMILALALGVAVLPLIWPTRPANRQLQRAVSLLGLAAASVVALYLLSGITNTATHLEIGFVLVLAGQLVLWIGTAREYLRGLHTTRHPFPAPGI